MKRKFIQLTKAERQSNLNRQRAAEELILQMPATHEGRNTWLLNYGIGHEARTLRSNRNLLFDEKTEACETFRKQP